MATKESKAAPRKEQITRKASSTWPLAPGKTRKAKPKTPESKRKKKPRFSSLPTYRPLEFPEVKGKTIAGLRLYLHGNDNGVSIYFADRTQLSFALEPRLSIRPELGDVKTGEWRSLKTWPALMSESSWLDEHDETESG